MTVVIDASVAIAWSLPDEDDELAEFALKSVQERGGEAPSFLQIEVANVMVVALRRNRIGEEQFEFSWENFSSLPIRYDKRAMSELVPRASKLAIRVGLSLYDALYLDLAYSNGIPLATLDRKLALAADAVGVQLLNSAT